MTIALLSPLHTTSACPSEPAVCLPDVQLLQFNLERHLVYRHNVSIAYCGTSVIVVLLLLLLLLLTAVTRISLSSCGPLSHSQSQRRQRRVDQRSHRLADLLPSVCVDHPAAWPAGPGLPAALPPLHSRPAQTGGQLRPSSRSKSLPP